MYVQREKELNSLLTIDPTDAIQMAGVGMEKEVGGQPKGTAAGEWATAPTGRNVFSAHNSLQLGKNWGESSTELPERTSTGATSQGRLNGGGNCLVFWRLFFLCV